MVYDSDTAHQVALEQAHNIGFDGSIDFGKADKLELLEICQKEWKTSPPRKVMAETSL
jgi:hypothetical protein